MQRPRLSKEEIDLLLNGIREGSLPDAGEARDKAGNVEPYDISGLERVGQARLAGMEGINAEISMGMQTSIGAFIGRPVRTEVEGVTVSGYDRFVDGIRPDSVICVFTLTPLAGRGLLVIEPQTAGIILDVFFGGAVASRTSVYNRISPIGRAAVEKVAAGLVGVIRRGWADAAAAEFECERFESNPASVARLMGAAGGLVYLAAFKVSIGAGAGRINICLPHGAVEPVRWRLVNACSAEERKAWSDGLMRRFCEIPVTLKAEMGTALFSARDLLSLKTGDIIEIDRKVMEPLDVLVEGQPVFIAAPGAIGSRYAVRITGVRDAEV